MHTVNMYFDKDELSETIEFDIGPNDAYVKNTSFLVAVPTVR